MKSSELQSLVLYTLALVVCAILLCLAFTFDTELIELNRRADRIAIFVSILVTLYVSALIFVFAVYTVNMFLIAVKRIKEQEEVT